MDTKPICLTIGHAILKYGKDGPSELYLWPCLFDRVSSNEEYAKQEFSLIARSVRKYLLDEGWEKNFNVPFLVIRNDNQTLTED